MKVKKSYLKTLIKKCLNEQKADEMMFNGDIRVNRNIASKVNKELHVFNTKPLDKIPLQPIFDILKKYKLTPLQEDGTEWDGFLLGRNSKTTIELGYEGKIVKNFALQLSWYKYDSGRYEINTYIS